jgi:hypothetical protein
MGFSEPRILSCSSIIILDLDCRKFVRVDEHQFKPTEVGLLMADSSKGKGELDLEVNARSRDLARIMADADFRACRLETLGEGGQSTRENLPNRRWMNDRACLLPRPGLVPQRLFWPNHRKCMIPASMGFPPHDRSKVNWDSHMKRGSRTKPDRPGASIVCLLIRPSTEDNGLRVHV